MSLPVWPHVLSRGYGTTSCLVPCSFQGVSGPREGPVWSQGGRVCYQEVSDPGGGLVWGREFASVGEGGSGLVPEGVWHYLLVDRRTDVKVLLSRNFVCGR